MYISYAGPAAQDPRKAEQNEIADGIYRIVEAEGPIVAKRAYEIYLRSCGIRRLGHELKSMMNKALAQSIRQGKIVSEDELMTNGYLLSVIRPSGSPAIRLRTRGPRDFEEIPPSELQVVAKFLATVHALSWKSDEHFRAILECFELKRLTTQVNSSLNDILDRQLAHAEEYAKGFVL